MTPDQERRLEELFDAARALSPEACAAFLDRACAGDAVLRQEVESLLAAHEKSGEFLLHPVAIGAGAAQKTMLLPPLSELTGTRIGHYKLLEQIGEGGFGVVWMAEQEEPVRRRVALKIIKLGMDREVVARFEAERQALAMTDHPNIASVFDGGATDTGRPYFVMELVKGVPITEYCDANKLSTPKRLELFMQVCHAVQHAHQKGIIHRDLKPSNVLVTEQDDRPVPKVIDFGVAKATQARLTEKTLFTHFGQWIGTPAYMSPEQAGLGSLDVDTRSDIYSLGVLLYELLTGRTPFDTQNLLAAGYDAVMRTIREEDPPKPSARLSTLAKEELNAVAARRGAEPAKLGRLVRGDLDWIVMKALEKDRTRRYETANAFAQDVAAYLEQEPVSAAAPSAAYRARRFIGRNRLVVGFSTALALTLVSGTIISALLAVREKQSSLEADKQRAMATNEAARALRFAQESERARNQTEAGAYANRVVLASQRVEAGDLSQADRLLEACPAPLRQWEWHYLMRQCQPQCRVLAGQSNEVWGLAASLDGCWLASVDKDSRLLLWDLNGNLSQPAQAWPAMGKTQTTELRPVNKALVFSHDSRTLAYACPGVSNQWVLRLTPVSGTNGPRELVRLTGKFRPLCLSFGPDNGTLMVASTEGVIRSYDVTSGLESKSYPILAAAFSQDGRRVASAGVTRLAGEEEKVTVRTIKVFDTTSGQELLAITNLSEPRTLFSFALSPDGKRVAAGFAEIVSERAVTGDDYNFGDILQVERGSVVVWDLLTRKEVLRSRLRRGGPLDLNFSPDGRQLAVACADLRTSIGIIPLGGEVGIAPAAAHSTANPGKVLVLDALTGEEIVSLCGHLGGVTASAFVNRGSRLASASSDRTVRLWEIGPSRIIPLGGRWLKDKPYLKLATGSPLSSDGSMITLPTLDGSWDVLDLVTGKTLCSARLSEAQRIQGAALTRAPPTLVYLSDTALHDFDLAVGRESWSFSITNLGLGGDGVLAASPDGQRVALACGSGRSQGDASDLVLLETGSGRLIFRRKISGPGGVTFSPNSRLLVAGDYDGNVGVWDAASGAEVLSQRAAEQRPGASISDLFLDKYESETNSMGIPVTAVAVSPAGNELATAAGVFSAELRLWDLAAKQPKWVGLLPCGASAMAFSPDSRRLAVACTSLAGTTHLLMFDTLSGQELLHLPARAGVESLAFSPDGARLWGVTVKGTLVFWEAPPWPGPIVPPVVALRHCVVESLELQDERLAMKTVLRQDDQTFNGHLVFIPGSSLLALAGERGSVRLLRLPSGEVETILTGAEGEITSLAVSANGNNLLAGTDRGFVFSWSGQKNPPARIPPDNRKMTKNLAVSPDGSRAVWRTLRDSKGPEEKVVAVDVASGREHWSADVRYRGPSGAQVASFSGNGNIFFAMQRKLLLVDAETGRTLRELVCEGLPPDCDPISTAVSPDARLCAAGYTASNGCRIGIWSLSEGKLLRLFKTQDQDWIRSLAFSPDGSVLASGAADCTASVWEIATGREIGRLRLRGSYDDMHVSISDDGRWLAAGRIGEYVVCEMPGPPARQMPSLPAK